MSSSTAACSQGAGSWMSAVAPDRGPYRVVLPPIGRGGDHREAVSCGRVVAELLN